MDVGAVRDAATGFIERARAGEGPAFLECLAERFSSHSTATRETRSTETMAALRGRCPIDRLAATLAAAERAALQTEVDAEVAAAVAFAEAAPFPDAAEALSDVV
jgi:pyruvate dehydrogenase E1 component alpha subunit